MRKPKPIKPFKTLEEEANFWETHDVSTVFNDPKTPLSKLLPLESEKKEVLTIRIQKSVKDKLENLAKIKGINPTTLSRMLIIERLIQLEHH